MKTHHPYQNERKCWNQHLNIQSTKTTIPGMKSVGIVLGRSMFQIQRQVVQKDTDIHLINKCKSKASNIILITKMTSPTSYNHKCNRVGLQTIYWRKALLFHPIQMPANLWVVQEKLRFSLLRFIHLPNKLQPSPRLIANLWAVKE